MAIGPKPPSARRFYLVLDRDRDGRIVELLRTRSAVVALDAAGRVETAWVEGDDHAIVWPHSPADGEARWDTAQLRRWADT